MAETTLDISTKKAIDELKALQAEIVKTGNVAEGTKKDLDDAFKIGAAQGMADAIDDLQTEFQQLERSAKTLRAALKNTTDPKLIELYRTNIGRLEQGMKKLETTGKAAGVNVRELNKEASTGRQVFGELFGAFTKVALIVEAIRLVKEFVVESVNLAEQTRKVQLQLEAFTGSAEKAGAIVQDLTALAQERLLNVDEVLEAGKGLLAFGESAENLVPVLGRIADISAATGKNFNELSIIYGKARAAGVLYAEDINQLVDAGIPIIGEFAKQLNVSADEVKKLASEGKISFEELQLAFFNLTAEGGRFAEQSKINAQTVSGAWQGLLNDLRPVFEAVGEFFSFAARKTIGIFRDLIGDIKELFGAGTPTFDVELADREALRQDRAAYEKELNEREKLEKAAADARKKRNQASAKEAADLERERQRAIIDGMAEGMAKEIAIENQRFAELKKRLDKFHLDTEDAENEHRKRLLEIQLKYYVSTIDAQTEAEIAAKEQFSVEADTREEALKKRFDAAQKQLELEKEIFEGFLLERQKNFIAENEANEKTAEQRKAFDENLARAREEFQLIAQQKELENLLEFGQFRDETEKKILEQRLANIKEAISQLGELDAPEGKKPFDLLEFLGIDEDNRQEFERAVGQIVEGINQITQARLDSARAAVDAANEQVRAAEDAVEAAEEKLDREIEIAETGEANNLALRQQELAAAEQQAAAAKKIRDEAIKEQQKAARAQLVVDSATQASGIITATANIFKNFSALPFVGIALAAAQIASMIALFASIRAKAKAISAQKLKTGGEVKGRDKVFGEPDSDGEILVRATPGEYVTNKKQSQKHRPLLEAINAGDTAKMTLYLERMSQGARRDTEATAGAASPGVSVTVNAADPKLRELMKRNNTLQNRTFEMQKNRPQVFDMGDHYLKVKNGRRERIKKRQR